MISSNSQKSATKWRHEQPQPQPQPQGQDNGQTPEIALAAAAKVWAKIGLLSFGGPAGQIALMHRILVEEKRWITDVRFMHALNFCMILPGPEAQQLATYVGWQLHRIRGGLIAGTLFIVPGFIVILGLSYLYVFAGTLPLIQGLFLGLKAAVIAIVLQAVIRIGRRSLTQPLLAWLAALSFVSMFVFGIPFPVIIAISAAIGYLSTRRSLPAFDLPELESGTHLELSIEAGQSHSSGASSATRDAPRYALKVATAFALLWLVPVLAIVTLLGPDHVFSGIGTFFSKMAVVTFGGAYAVLAYVAQEAVQAYEWLVPSEMIDGLAMAETTPGPLIMVVQYVGFMAAYKNPGLLTPAHAAFLGSLLAIWVTFIPCFLWIFLGAPHMERLRQNKALAGAFAAVTAAVVGVIGNLAVWFTIHSIFSEVTAIKITGLSLEIPALSSFRTSSVLITLIAMVLIFRLNASVPVTLLVTALLGMATFVV